MLLGDPFAAAGDSLIAESRKVSALGVLEQCPVPSVAVADDGGVLFVNTAFAHLLGYSCEALTSISYEDICSALPADETLFAVTRLGSKAIGGLIQSGQGTVFIKIRKSATLSAAGSDAVAMFKVLMERLSR